MTNKERKFNAEKKEALRKNACDIAKVLIDSALEIIKDPELGVDISIKTNIEKDALIIQRGLIKMTQFNKSKVGGIIVTNIPPDPMPQFPNGRNRGKKNA